ncbi:MAG: hypothetical protein ABSD87_01850, partial [Candidatus Acidiferrales bacterium]
MNRSAAFALRAMCSSFILATFFLACGVFAAAFALPFGEWTRVSPTPILSPQGDGFESAGIFNPTVVKKDGEFVMLYRAQDRNGTS